MTVRSIHVSSRIVCIGALAWVFGGTALAGTVFTTGRSYRVLDGKPGPLPLRLVSAARPEVLTGMFLYMADAASLTLCKDGRRLPVVMEGDYRKLEEAYLHARREPREEILVELEGSISSRPPAEEGARPRTVVVVKRFIAVRRGETCETRASQRPLRNTYWKLVRLGDAPVEVVEQQQEPNLVLAGDQPRVSGSGGCNRLTGGFTLDGSKLKFTGMASTMMACLEAGEQETRFLQMLGKVQGYRIEGNHLELLDAGGTVLARFEAVDLH
jgi:heat shock protein HslJ